MCRCDGGRLPRGGGPLAIVRGVWHQALSLSRLPVLGAVSRAPLPMFSGRRCGDPAPAPQRAPLRAGVARCGGGRGASPGRVSRAVVRGVQG